MKSYLTIFVLVIFVISGCKKYPEGGRRNGLSSTESRISGPYRFQELTVNGADTSLAGSPCLCSDADFRLYYDDSGAGRIWTSYCCNFPANTWYVTGDRRHLIVTHSYTSSAVEMYPIAINNDRTVDWTIQKLTKDDLWLQTSLNQREYHLKLHYAH